MILFFRKNYFFRLGIRKKLRNLSKDRIFSISPWYFSGDAKQWIVSSPLEGSQPLIPRLYQSASELNEEDLNRSKLLSKFPTLLLPSEVFENHWCLTEQSNIFRTPPHRQSITHSFHTDYFDWDWNQPKRSTYFSDHFDWQNNDSNLELLSPKFGGSDYPNGPEAFIVSPTVSLAKSCLRTNILVAAQTNGQCRNQTKIGIE